ncbi:Sterol O-acyltransferase 2 [Merluccius polli]|uniref:Sterol O-acyltransferase 2 n=1 Tax=Merluccius polli TaxID=89951 RepID=A0AA47P3W1_MERPO|nr:Sterol O-acyltransferase 2 [Merluccius polli]
MATTELPDDGPRLRNHIKAVLQSNEISSHAGSRADTQGEELRRLQNHVQKVKVKVLAEIQDQLSVLLDKALTESLQPLAQITTTADGKIADSLASGAPTGNRSHRMEDGKVFILRPSLLDELFEISHIRTIYHMFVAVLLVFCISTLAVDYIDQGSLICCFYAFGKLATVTWAWGIMFAYTLVVPYHAVALWGGRLPRGGAPSWARPSWGAAVGVALVAVQGLRAGAVPGARGGALPAAPGVAFHRDPGTDSLLDEELLLHQRERSRYYKEHAQGRYRETQRFPTFSSYLYFLFCPTLIYRESYPRNPHIRWHYVRVSAAMILGCLLYCYFILVRLCVPVFRNEGNKAFSTRTLVLAMFHSTLPDSATMKYRAKEKRANEKECLPKMAVLGIRNRNQLRGCIQWTVNESI